MSSTYWVRVIRDDRSITYRGSFRDIREAEREAGAWRGSFADYSVAIIPSTPLTRGMVSMWQRATLDGSRYYPTIVEEQTT